MPQRSTSARLGRAAALLCGAFFVVAAYVYVSLPDVRPLKHGNPESTAFMEMHAETARRAGKRLRRVHTWVPLARISPHLRRAVLVAEDSAFWEHDGLDLAQVRASLEQNLEQWRFVRGASTITQQLAKNLYLSPSRNPVRKVREVLLARRLERELGKRRILELYLNLVEWGDGLYGAEAAAQAYFHKPASGLTEEEAALLAGALINPKRYSPAKPPARLRNRQKIILGRMHTVSAG